MARRQRRRSTGTTGPGIGGGKLIGAGRLKGKPIGVIVVGGRPDPRRGPARSHPVQNTGFLDQFKMGREPLDKKRALAEVRARELVQGDLFIGQDGKMFRVVDIDNKSVKTVAVVGNGALKGRKEITLALDSTVRLFRRSCSSLDIAMDHSPHDVENHPRQRGHGQGWVSAAEMGRAVFTGELHEAGAEKLLGGYGPGGRRAKVEFGRRNSWRRVPGKGCRTNGRIPCSRRLAGSAVIKNCVPLEPTRQPLRQGTTPVLSL